SVQEVTREVIGLSHGTMLYLFESESRLVAMGTCVRNSLTVRSGPPGAVRGSGRAGPRCVTGPAAGPPGGRGGDHRGASHRLHPPSASISRAALLVIRPSGTRLIRALPPAMPRPATVQRARTAPRPTERGS